MNKYGSRLLALCLALALMLVPSLAAPALAAESNEEPELVGIENTDPGGGGDPDSDNPGNDPDSTGSVPDGDGEGTGLTDEDPQTGEIAAQKSPVQGAVAPLAQSDGPESDPAGTAQGYDDVTEPEFAAMSLEERFQHEMHLARYITSRGAAYEYDEFYLYLSYWFQKVWSVTDGASPKVDIANVSGGVAGGEKLVANLRYLRQQLNQTVDPEEISWYIWGDDMPEHENAGSYDYSRTYDEAGFKPFLVPYMLDDQDEVKGNVVVVAGGGFNQRCNDNEGDPVAVYLNGIGYNAFILQRRVLPSESLDSSLDLQRAIRYLRYNADELGIGGIDKMVTMGFSGGGMTILNQLKHFYGEITPDAHYADYVCDEIDEINADYDVAVIMYGAQAGYQTQNPNMPSLFICNGDIDNKVTPQQAVDLYLTALDNGWTAELFCPSNTHHGFGVSGVRAFSGVGYVNALKYLPLLETFLDIELGHIEGTFDGTIHYPTPSNPDPDPGPARTTGSGGGGRNSGSNTGGDRRSADEILAAFQANLGLSGGAAAGGAPVDQAAVLTQAQTALSAAGTTATVRVLNASSISAAALRALADAADAANKPLLLHADTLSASGAVQGRLYVDPGSISADLQLGVYTQGAAVEAVKSRFGSWFSNNIAVISLAQQGGFGARVRIAARVDLAGMDTDNLFFYTYDATANTYSRLADAEYFVDANGYLHLHTRQAGNIVVSSGALVKQ